ncbi:EndoU domain-containing protein [Virgibacillus sp. MSJ-26]|nr:EndoU domain-containing protein [Virgibacillus sp. MSJ-26]
MNEAVDSFESNPSGIVKEEYLQSDVKDGFDEVESKTIELTDDANSIIESVHDIVPITKIDESEVIESVRQGKDKVNDVVEELYELDDSQVRALEPILGRIKTMKQYITDLNAKFKSADLSVSSYNPVKIENMKAYNEIQTYLDEKDFAEKQEILKQRNDRPITERVSLESAEKKDNFFISGLKTTGRSIKGGFRGGVDMVVDTATGAYQMVRHPIQTYQSMEHMVLHPVETGKYMSNAIAESFTRDMINGDAESRSHWVTYTLGTILGTKGAGNAVKSTRVGSNVTKAAKESVKNATNKASNIQMPNLFPYGPQHQLATVGPVPYNVVDGVHLRDQMMMSAKKIADGGNKTRIYNDNSMGHIFLGEVNKRKKAVGYHHESMMGGKIIKDTKTQPDKNGVYRARVVINGKEKRLPSSFFPENWDRTDVLKAIHEAYENKHRIGNNKYEGTLSNGMRIQMYVNKDGTIATAFPIYEK